MDIPWKGLFKINSFTPSLIFGKSPTSSSPTESTGKRREINERVVALIIHGFTITHVITAAMLGPAAGAALTPMTTAMIFSIGLQCSINFSIASALKIAANLAGLIAGTAIAEFIIGLIPGLGNIANACATGIVTQILGWSAFIMLRDNIDGGNLSFWDKINLIRAAWKLRNKNEEFRKKLESARNRMNSSERSRYDRYMKILTNKESDYLQRRDAQIQVEEILKPYGITL